VVVVVSAMSGVTNKLIEAAAQSEAGDWSAANTILEELRKRHNQAMEALIRSDVERRAVAQDVHKLFEEGRRLCQGTSLLCELTPRVRDSILGLGERLCAPIIAAALAERGVRSQAVDATQVVITDSRHGSAEPWSDLTRVSCEGRLLPLLRQGVVPVVTGFIGATKHGVLTTLGRGGSDYSATILGSALKADEVVIWTDVNGLLTADPRLVTDARTIEEISYREAAELAYFGAKVLHPKTLRPVMHTPIPLWIKNTFAPEQHGTKITPSGPPSAAGAKALTSISDAALITIGGSGKAEVPDVLARTVVATATIRADVLAISQSSSENDVCLVVPLQSANSAVEALRHEFSQELRDQELDEISLEATVSIVTLVGQNLPSVSDVAERAFAALERAEVNVIATAQGATEHTLSFVVAQSDMKSALATVHRELELGAKASGTLSASGIRSLSGIWGEQELLSTDQEISPGWNL
jgi:aspartate kinase